MNNQNIQSHSTLCEPIAEYSRDCKMKSLFSEIELECGNDDIKIIELFAGVGGFRVGLERASSHYKTIWSNQWEPSTKKQDASIIYCRQFGDEGHSNQDINTVDVSEIPDADMLVGGFPCQDYSVATTLKNSGGIEGKKGVLWWQIHRILRDHPNPPKYVLLENVDRILSSPASQRGRDFAIILASLADLGYMVEWRVINAADYGMPQRRKRTYIFAFKKDTPVAAAFNDPVSWMYKEGILAKSFPVEMPAFVHPIVIEGDLIEISNNFNKGKSLSPFYNTGMIINRTVTTFPTKAYYHGNFLTLGDILIPDEEVPSEYIIPDSEVPKWEYAKSKKSEKRVHKTTGFEYNYSEGSMAFPDYTDRASRTIITGEGGSAPSRFKHIVPMSDGRLRRLTPIELERLNMFPDNHTEGSTDARRAFLMGNALVTGIVEKIGLSLLPYLQKNNK